MKPYLNRFLPTLAFAVAAAAMAGTAQAAAPKVEHGVLTGEHGMTLYTFAKDKAHSGKSECKGACAKLWPPDIASASSTASGKFSFVHRADGKMQWAYKGKPLYFFARDKKPGQETGNGYKHIWSVAKG
jgi:predicted lipoprotein with Yx(FWY)xxD motif